MVREGFVVLTQPVNPTGCVRDLDEYLRQRLPGARPLTLDIAGTLPVKLSSIADYASIVYGGKILDHGTPDAIRNSSSELVLQFLEGRHDGPIAFQYKASSLESDLMGSTST